jgi:hypothetical protein
MTPLLGHRPSLWITHKENAPLPTTRAQVGLVGDNFLQVQKKVTKQFVENNQTLHEFKQYNSGRHDNDVAGN